jgi:phosphatidylserine synthase
VPVFLYASFRGEYRLAFFIFAGAAFTDFLDGVIARRSGITGVARTTGEALAPVVAMPLIASLSHA